uniref:Uncharacterized protein n=1 Tax=Anguilla anguilla TaxID=7936 RepID=A0A0E9TVG0_ANGAN
MYRGVPTSGCAAVILELKKRPSPRSPQLHLPSGRDEHIGWLNVSVRDSAGVHVLQGTAELYKVLPYGPLRDEPPLLT